MCGYEGLKDLVCMCLRDILMEVYRVELVHLVLRACQIEGNDWRSTDWLLENLAGSICKAHKSNRDTFCHQESKTSVLISQRTHYKKGPIWWSKAQSPLLGANCTTRKGATTRTFVYVELLISIFPATRALASEEARTCNPGSGMAGWTTPFALPFAWWWYLTTIGRYAIFNVITTLN
jgi:hypothetical protein